MTAAIAVLLLVPAQPPAPPQPVALPSTSVLFRASGKGELKTETEWHKLDTKISVDADVPDAFDLSGLIDSPKSGVDKWRILPAKLNALFRLVHDIRWSSEDAEKFGNWQGTGPTRDKLVARGIVTATATRDANGTKVTFTGKPTVTDSGRLASRFGPNCWHDVWTHTITGTAAFDPNGSLVEFELVDEFVVSGQFNNGDLSATDTNTRKGTLKLTLRERKPLPADMAVRVARLLVDLAADDFGTRQKATTELATFAQETQPVADFILSLDPNALDPEVGLRVGMVRGKLRSK